MDTQNHPLLELAEIVKHINSSQRGIDITEDDETKTVDINIIELSGTAFAQVTSDTERSFMFQKCESVNSKTLYRTNSIRIIINKMTRNIGIFTLGTREVTFTEELAERLSIYEGCLDNKANFSISCEITEGGKINPDSYRYLEIASDGRGKNSLENTYAMLHTEGICRNIVDSLKKCLPNPELHTELRPR